MPCYFPQRIRNPKPSIRNPSEFIDIPCGKCFQCLQRKRNEWVLRMQREMRKYPTSTWFVTLTYDEEHLPDQGVDKEGCQKYLKQLKEVFPKMKYFFCSEYGPTTFRPHYHAVFFNTTIDHYEIINKLHHFWRNGIIEVTLVTSERLGYVAGYEITRSEVPEGKAKNFRLISKGIGAPTSEDDLKYIAHFRKTGIRNSDGRLTPIPRYLLDKVCNEEEKYLIQQKKKKISQRIFEKETRSIYQLMDLQKWDQVKLERAKKKPKSI